jgi:hypothetical protein
MSILDKTVICDRCFFRGIAEVMPMASIGDVVVNAMPFAKVPLGTWYQCENCKRIYGTGVGYFTATTDGMSEQRLRPQCRSEKHTVPAMMYLTRSTVTPGIGVFACPRCNALKEQAVQEPRLARWRPTQP